jgi:phospholipase C
MPGVTTVPDDAALRNLVSKVDHIVVLMMENRSFDHMLGYLTIDGGRADIEGLRKGQSNNANGKDWPVHKAARTSLVKAQDPRHGHVDVEKQIADGAMSDFAENYWATRGQPSLHGDSPGTVMAYHTAAQLPVYDYFAANFCICDHWFCSVPGETMPNRCYAVAGTSGGRLEALNPPRPYGLKSFCRQLDAVKPKAVPWVWFSHDYVPMLWIIDPKYAAGSIPRYFDKSDVLGHASFVERAAKGQLPAVSWIDPNFIDLTFGPAGSNDDHPPSDLHAGQKLALALFDAVAQGPLWEKTMVIVTYDEHGGFYDHVPPPACEDDSPQLRSLGPRVPAFVLSPWVGAGSVSSTIYDHTSIIKTILARFCRKANGTVPDMGARVRAAPHLGGVLTEPSARPAIPRSSYQKLVAQTQSWGDKLAAHETIPTRESLQAEASVTDFQQEFLALRQAVLAQRSPDIAAPPPN